MGRCCEHASSVAIQISYWKQYTDYFTIWTVGTMNKSGGDNLHTTSINQKGNKPKHNQTFLSLLIEQICHCLPEMKWFTDLKCDHELIEWINFVVKFNKNQENSSHSATNTIAKTPKVDR